MEKQKNYVGLKICKLRFAKPIAKSVRKATVIKFSNTNRISTPVNMRTQASASEGTLSNEVLT